MLVTRDRERIIHFASRRGLSPAVRSGAPALLAHGEQEGRCGWEPFFRAMEARRLALATGSDGGFRFVPAGEGGSSEARGAGWLADLRRFIEALRGHPPRVEPDRGDRAHRT